MKNKDLIPVTDNSLKDFINAKKENKPVAMQMQKWIEHKKKYFSNFLSYAFDKEGNLYRRDFLTKNGWVKVNTLDENDLKR